MVEYSSVAVEAAKTRAKKLANRLKDLGVPIKHSQALEALSASDGHLDWNRYTAYLNQLQSSPKNPRPMVLFSVPGGGASITWRMHSLNLIEQNPTGHAIILYPYVLRQKRAQEWMKHVVVLSGNQDQLADTLYWQVQLGNVEGKIIEIMPPVDFYAGSKESHKKISDWILAVSHGWNLWKEKTKTSGIFLTEAFRYFRNDTQKNEWSQLLNTFQSVPLFIFTQVMEDLKNLEDVHPHVFILKKDLALSHRDKIFDLNVSFEIVPDRPRHFSHHELGDFKGWVRAIGAPLTAKFNFSGEGSRWDLFKEIMSKELDIHEEKIMREVLISIE